MDGINKQDAWSRLTIKEQHIVSAKLPCEEIRSANYEFNIRFTGKDGIETEALITTIRNLIDNAGAHSDNPVWSLIRSIDGGWIAPGDPRSAALAVTVHNTAEFLGALELSGFEVDHWYELASIHRHSARFVTDNSYQPGMHFVQLCDYPCDRFDVHWDTRSVAFRSKDRRFRLLGPFDRIIERLAAGMSHSRAVSATRVRRELEKMGLTPDL
ncbi:MAG: hypothetical protein IPM66_13490 [Acidobacteriota bacterium]|nr:MAG: hypothetical protein IPM66_13490 [Acidobacteriota bacterium]